MHCLSFNLLIFWTPVAHTDLISDLLMNLPTSVKKTTHPIQSDQTHTDIYFSYALCIVLIFFNRKMNTRQQSFLCKTCHTS